MLHHTVLSEEETLAKFEECFDAGYNHCAEKWDGEEYGSGYSKETAVSPNWEQFKECNL